MTPGPCDDDSPRLAGGQFTRFRLSSKWRYISGSTCRWAARAARRSRDIAAVDGRRLARAAPRDVDANFPPARHGKRHQRCAADAGPKDEQIVLGQRWMVEDLDVHGRHAAEIRDPVCFRCSSTGGSQRLMTTSFRQRNSRFRAKMPAVKQREGNHALVAADAETSSALFSACPPSGSLISPADHAPGVQKRGRSIP